MVAVLGAIVGLLLGPATRVEVGPLTATVHLRPSLQSETVILLPPVGEVRFDTHTAPVQVEMRVQGVDIDLAEQLLYSDDAAAQLSANAPEALTGAAARNAAAHAGVAAIGAGPAPGASRKSTPLDPTHVAEPEAL